MHVVVRDFLGLVHYIHSLASATSSNYMQVEGNLVVIPQTVAKIAIAIVHV